MSRIQDVRGRLVFDARGNPTVEAEVETGDGVFRAIVPSSNITASGKREAQELRDGTAKFNGKGVTKAINNINNDIAVAITGMDPTDQEGIDQALMDLDGGDSSSKNRLGSNAILAVSMAVCRAGAAKKGIPLYKHINNLAGNPAITLPVPCFNVLHGGRHAGNQLPIQEIMILPTGASSYSEAMEIGVEVYHTLKKIIKSKYGALATAVGDEGGFAPNVKSNDEALQLIKEAVGEAGYTDAVQVAIDVAASEFWVPEKRKYNLGFKSAGSDSRVMKTSDELLRMYKLFAANYSVISIEDPFHRDDVTSYTKMTAELNELIQIIGDDLLVSDPDFVDRAVEENYCNAVLLTLNQIGSVTEAIDTNNRARNAGFGVMVSHQSGDTEDTFIADFSAGLGCGQIKAGAPCRSERVAKYNELLRIESDLGESVSFAGEYWRDPWMLPPVSKKQSEYM